MEQLHVGAPYQFRLITVPIRDLDDDALAKLSRNGQLYLTLVEMQTIQQYFRQLGRDPTDIELETVAQTWSEHCSHKTLAGRIVYRDASGERRFENMLKETIFAATQQIRRQLGADDWCVSVFKDNAGVVRFDDQYNVVFKVETHNHPSALEPYGGANTGIGGVIRDPLGTGLGAKPVCNTDVFCFAPPETRPEDLPPGVLHPRRVMKGVVSGVRDYGNRMGIPTVNGAVYFDPRYLGNPLVYCGTVGILPCDKSFKEPQAGDWIVAIGGRTGRDGIHGATFSSAELTSESETVSGGAVQIGNAITEKMVLDVLLAARDRGLYHAVTDCGAGGFSSAVGEMGEHIGAEVWLERAPLKYEGLSYTEIWISEAQERMVLSVPDEHWPEFSALCASEGVEATIIGQFVPTGRLELKYDGQPVGELGMEFLHDGRPPVVRTAVYEPPPVQPLTGPPRALAAGRRDRPRRAQLDRHAAEDPRLAERGQQGMGDPAVRSRSPRRAASSSRWSACRTTAPSDAAVLRPVLSSRRGLVIACGMNPRYGDFDTYHMAASAIDEAIRNCVAVGADPRRIAILDNFCWGYTDRPETLGSLVRAALACHDLAVVLQTPFISGKDSLNNEFSYTDADGRKRTIAIPPSLLISALGQVDDVGRCVTMDLKEPGNLIYQVGLTRAELGGSHLSLVEGLTGGQVPTVDAAAAKRTFAAVHAAISAGCVRACHDLSEGGLAVAAAEMAFAGGLGMSLHLDAVPHDCGDLRRGETGRAACCSPNRTRDSCAKCRRTRARPSSGRWTACRTPSWARSRPEPVCRSTGRAPPSRAESRESRAVSPEAARRSAGRCQRGQLVGRPGDRCGTCGLEGSVAEAAALVRMPMAKPRVLVLRAPGTNCDQETAYAFEQAGGSGRRVPRESAAGEPAAGAGLPDPVRARRLQLRRRRGGRPDLGQLVSAPLEGRHDRVQGGGQADPGHLQRVSSADQVRRAAGGRRAGPPATLCLNDRGRYEDRWVHLAADGDKCVFLRGVDQLELPVAHAEGKFVARSEAELARLAGAGQLVLRYVNPTGAEDVPFPHNPNGSQANVAGICDETGRVLGLMPHPERNIDPTHHPQWTRRRKHRARRRLEAVPERRGVFPGVAQAERRRQTARTEMGQAKR